MHDDGLTHDPEVDSPPDGWAGGDETLVNPFVRLLRELNLELPIIGLLMKYLEASVVAVGRQAIGQEVGMVISLSLEPRNLKNKKTNITYLLFSWKECQKSLA